MKRNGLLKCGVALLTTSSALADQPKQEMPALALEMPAPALETLSPPDYRPWTVAIESGTMGFVGGSVSWRFADHFGARVGVDWAGFSNNNLAVDSLHYDASIRLLSEPLTFDLYPWKDHSFHISVGALFNQNKLSGTSTDKGIVTIDNISFPSRPGDFSMTIHQQPVNPYLSFGGNFFYFDHAHHWAMGGEAGVAYMGDPDVSASQNRGADPVLRAVLPHVKSHLENYANDFKWWPVLKLNVSYSF
jgi:hypothetical protein